MGVRVTPISSLRVTGLPPISKSLAESICDSARLLEIEVPGYLGIEKTHHVRMKKIDWTAAKIPVPNALAMTAVPLVSFVSTLGARYRAWYPPYLSRARPSFAGQKNR
jgi:hypothetical protein